MYTYARVVRYSVAKYKDTVAKWKWKRIMYEQLFDRHSNVEQLNDRVRAFVNEFSIDRLFQIQQLQGLVVEYTFSTPTWYVVRRFVANGLETFAIFPVFRPGPEALAI